MKRKLSIIGILTVVVVLILLTVNATIDKPNRKKNGFKRTFSKESAILNKQADFGIVFQGVCGISGDSIFLQGKDPSKIYITSTALTKLDTINLNLPNIPKLTSGFSTIVIYPKVYILASNARSLILADLAKGINEIIEIKTAGAFVNSSMISSGEFVIREIDSNTRNTKFKILGITGKTTKSETDISIPLADAGFTYSGRLNFDQKNHYLIYVTSYLNKIICFDTNLKMIYQSRTIDTNATVKTKLEKNKNGITYKSPPTTLNGPVATHDGVIYINSKLKADNEIHQEFRNSLVIDKYLVKDGHYMGSLYIPNISDQKSLKFGILQDGRLLITQEKTIMIYDAQKQFK